MCVWRVWGQQRESTSPRRAPRIQDIWRRTLLPLTRRNSGLRTVLQKREFGAAFLPGYLPQTCNLLCWGTQGRYLHMATAGTPVRRARSFHRVRAPLNELGEPARSYHGRAMSSLSLKEHTRSSGDAGSSSSHASFPANREPSLPPACGTPVRRARSFQRVLSPRRERSCSLPAEGASSGSGDGVGGVEVTQEKGGGSGSGSSGAPFPSAGRPVRRAGSFQRVVYPRSSRRSKPSPWPL